MALCLVADQGDKAVTDRGQAQLPGSSRKAAMCGDGDKGPGPVSVHTLKPVVAAEASNIEIIDIR